MLKVGLATVRGGQIVAPVAEILAMVDSGAFRTCLPKQIAYDLGITDAELNQDPDGGTGVGSSFRFWTTDVEIVGMVGLFQPAADGSLATWGPGIPLSPAFTETDAFLLGRADFFKVFTVAFAEEGAETVFYLDAPDADPGPA